MVSSVFQFENLEKSENIFFGSFFYYFAMNIIRYFYGPDWYLHKTLKQNENYDSFVGYCSVQFYIGFWY